MLVFFVVWLFLYNLRATIIPSVAVPVSLVGTFAGMYLLGFSINSLTLFGMVLAIGIVVDDAIVVLENVERHMRDEHVERARGHAPRDGRGQPARDRDRARAERRVPARRVPGRARRRDVPAVRDHDRGVGHDLGFRRADADARDVRAAAARRAKSSRSGLLARFDAGFLQLTRAYTGGVRWMMRHAYVAAAVMLLMVAAIVWLERSVPSALAPSEDQGYVLALAGAAAGGVDAAHEGRARCSSTRRRSRIRRSSTTSRSRASTCRRAANAATPA